MAVLETPWFMKTKTSDLGRINKVFDERFQASIALIQIKQRRTLMKLDDEIKTIKNEFKHIRSEVDFSKDLDEHGKPLDEKTCKDKASGQDYRLRHGKHFQGLNGTRSVPPELEMEHQRYLKIRQRDKRRQMTMLELRDMCYKCVNEETGDEANKYIQRAKLVLFPKQRKPSNTRLVKDEDASHFSKYGNVPFSKDSKHSSKLPVPRIDTNFGKDTPESVPLASDRVPIRPSSAGSVASIKPALPRYKTMNIVGSSDMPSALGLMTSVSV